MIFPFNQMNLFLLMNTDESETERRFQKLNNSVQNEDESHKFNKWLKLLSSIAQRNKWMRRKITFPPLPRVIFRSQLAKRERGIIGLLNVDFGQLSSVCDVM